MNIYLLLLLLITIYCLFYRENFDIVGYTLNNEFEAPYKSDKYTTKPNKINCCLVEKKFMPPGEFKYIFNRLNDKMCDYKLYNLDSNKQLFTEGENGWNNEMCDNTKLGSCRWINKECIDFVDKKFCDKYKMTWAPVTCQNPLPFVWKDRMNRIPPKPKGEGIVNMFPQNSKKSDAKKK